MERERNVNVFEGDLFDEIKTIQSRLLELNVQSEIVKVETEDQEEYYKLLVDIQDESKAFEYIDQYLNQL